MDFPTIYLGLSDSNYPPGQGKNKLNLNGYSNYLRIGEDGEWIRLAPRSQVRALQHAQELFGIDLEIYRIPTNPQVRLGQVWTRSGVKYQITGFEDMPFEGEARRYWIMRHVHEGTYGIERHFALADDLYHFYTLVLEP